MRCLTQAACQVSVRKRSPAGRYSIEFNIFAA
jgi:hypothetical protein